MYRKDILQEVKALLAELPESIMEGMSQAIAPQDAPVPAFAQKQNLGEVPAQRLEAVVASSSRLIEGIGGTLKDFVGKLDTLLTRVIAGRSRLERPRSDLPGGAAPDIVVPRRPHETFSRSLEAGGPQQVRTVLKEAAKENRLSPRSRRLPEAPSPVPQPVADYVKTYLQERRETLREKPPEAERPQPRPQVERPPEPTIIPAREPEIPQAETPSERAGPAQSPVLPPGTEPKPVETRESERVSGVPPPSRLPIRRKEEIPASAPLVVPSQAQPDRAVQPPTPVPSRQPELPTVETSAPEIAEQAKEISKAPVSPTVRAARPEMSQKERDRLVALGATLEEPTPTREAQPVSEPAPIPSRTPTIAVSEPVPAPGKLTMPEPTLPHPDRLEVPREAPALPGAEGAQTRAPLPEPPGRKPSLSQEEYKELLGAGASPDYLKREFSLGGSAPPPPGGPPAGGPPLPPEHEGPRRKVGGDGADEVPSQRRYFVPPKTTREASKLFRRLGAKPEVGAEDFLGEEAAAYIKRATTSALGKGYVPVKDVLPTPDRPTPYLGRYSRFIPPLLRKAIDSPLGQRAFAGMAAGSVVGGALRLVGVPGGIAAGAGRLAMAGAAGGPWALAAMGAFELGKALVTLPPKLAQFAEGITKSNFRLAAFSPTIAGAQAQFSIREMQRDIKLAQEIGPSTAILSDATSDAKDSLHDLTVAFDKGKSTLGIVAAKAAEGLSVLTKPLAQGYNATFGNPLIQLQQGRLVQGGALAAAAMISPALFLAGGGPQMSAGLIQKMLTDPSGIKEFTDTLTNAQQPWARFFDGVHRMTPLRRSLNF